MPWTIRSSQNGTKRELQRPASVSRRNCESPLTKAVEDTREKLHQRRQEIEEVKAQIEGLRLSELKARHSARQRLEAVDKEILEAKNKVKTVQSRSRLKVRFESTLTATVEDTREKLHQTHQQIEEAKAQVQELNLSEVKAKHGASQRLAVADREILAARNRMETARSRFRLTEGFERKLETTVENTRQDLHASHREIEDVNVKTHERHLSELKAQHEHAVVWLRSTTTSCRPGIS